MSDSDHHSLETILEARLRKIEEGQLYAQHDHDATKAALEDLSQRLETLLMRLTRLEARMHESRQTQSPSEQTPPDHDASAPD